MTDHLNKTAEVIKAISGMPDPVSRYAVSVNSKLESFENTRKAIKIKYKKPVKYLSELKKIEQEMSSGDSKLSGKAHKDYLEFLEKYFKIELPVISDDILPNRTSKRKGGHIIVQ